MVFPPNVVELKYSLWAVSVKRGLHTVSLLRRRSLGSSRNIPPIRTSAEANGTFLSLCSKRFAGEHVEITEEPIGARLLFNRKPIISCDRTTPNRRKNCFLCSFPLVPQASIRVLGKSSVDIAHLIECAVHWNRFEYVFVQRPVRL